MRKTGSRGILSDMDLSAAGFVFQSKNLVILQLARRINNNLAARLNIFRIVIIWSSGTEMHPPVGRFALQCRKWRNRHPGCSLGCSRETERNDRLD